MSARYSGAGPGLILGIIAAFILLALGIWGVIHWVSSDVQNEGGPVQHIETGKGGR
jgi:hypothetical protein